MSAVNVIIFITLCLISGQGLCFEVFGCTGGSLMIKCVCKDSHKNNDQQKGKYFCRDGDRDCTTGIRTEQQNRWVKQGRFALYDDGNSRFFRVFIINLSSEDDGNYKCGDQKWSHDVELEVNSESHCGTSVIQYGYSGKTLTFPCEYDQKFERNTKVVYRLNGGDPVFVLDSRSRSTPSPEQKILLYDSWKDHFTVTITTVSEEDDGGVYLCGVEELGVRRSSPSHTTFIKEIQLNVSLLAPPVVGREGDSVQIRCPYYPELSKEIKILLKGKCFSEDARIFGRSDEDHRKNQISVKDDTGLRLFTVNMSNLRAEDAGIYCCTVNNPQKKKNQFNLPIELMIVRRDAITHKASVGGSVSIRCRSSRDPSLKAFCRGDQPGVCDRDGVYVSSHKLSNGRFSLTDQPSAGDFTVDIRNLTAEDSGKYWCAEEIDGSFILTEVHLNVGGEVTSPDSRKETTEMTSPDSRKETTESPSTDSREEETETTLPNSKEEETETTLPDSREEKTGIPVIIGVCVCLILLTVGLALLFWLFKKKRNRKQVSEASPDRRETEDGAQDSDPASTPLYSTIESPTAPTDGLLYSTVNFQKHEKSLSEAKVTLEKEEFTCEYAAVNHRVTPN